jgi:hypothetical protein
MLLKQHLLAGGREIHHHLTKTSSIVLSQTYTSVSDNAQEVMNPPGINPTSLGK